MTALMPVGGTVCKLLIQYESCSRKKKGGGVEVGLDSCSCYHESLKHLDVNSLSSLGM